MLGTGQNIKERHNLSPTAEKRRGFTGDEVFWSNNLIKNGMLFIFGEGEGEPTMMETPVQ